MSPENSTIDSSKLGELQHFLDGAIHALRAPLRGIGTSAGMLSRKWNEQGDEETRGLLRAILDGVTNLNNLTKSLSDYSNSLIARRSGIGPLPVENALQTALARLQPEIEKTGAEVYTGNLPKLEADHEQLSLLFRCLLSNALAYCGAVRPRIEITATAAGNEWRFAVSDNGIGMPAKFHRQVFEPFESLQSDQHGFGLGLAIVKKIVAAHGGRLWVNSQEGDGSTFFFTLPIQV